MFSQIELRLYVLCLVCEIINVVARLILACMFGVWSSLSKTSIFHIPWPWHDPLVIQFVVIDVYLVARNRGISTNVSHHGATLFLNDSLPTLGVIIIIIILILLIAVIHLWSLGSFLFEVLFEFGVVHLQQCVVVPKRRLRALESFLSGRSYVQSKHLRLHWLRNRREKGWLKRFTPLILLVILFLWEHTRMELLFLNDFPLNIVEHKFFNFRLEQFVLGNGHTTLLMMPIIIQGNTNWLEALLGILASFFCLVLHIESLYRKLLCFKPLRSAICWPRANLSGLNHYFVGV